MKYTIVYMQTYPFKIWLKKQGKLLVAIERAEFRHGDTFHETSYRPVNVQQTRDLQELIRDANQDSRGL